MENVRFDQLTLRINEPYWMLHQGNCEHIFTVDEIRAIHPTDPPLTSIPTANLSTPAPTTTTTENKAPRQEESQSRQTVYPITSFLSRINSPKCRVCDRDPARLIIINDELCAESPCFICFTCFKFLHSHEDIFLDHHLHQSSTTTVVDEISNSDSAPTLGNSSGRKIRWGKVKGGVVGGSLTGIYMNLSLSSLFLCPHPLLYFNPIILKSKLFQNHRPHSRHLTLEQEVFNHVFRCNYPLAFIKVHG
ncbi:hypothetical protein KEM48_004508 [Puccinia striiformis f. sp. tritici PST-130]|nr:hypothetical protein KEM48_004508 [Puccinia striiformis f. sp. tritici PST-130]